MPNTLHIEGHTIYQQMYNNKLKALRANETLLMTLYCIYFVILTQLAFPFCKTKYKRIYSNSDETRDAAQFRDKWSSTNIDWATGQHPEESHKENIIDLLNDLVLTAHDGRQQAALSSVQCARAVRKVVAGKQDQFRTEAFQTSETLLRCGVVSSRCSNLAHPSSALANVRLPSRPWCPLHAVWQRLEHRVTALTTSAPPKGAPQLPMM